MAMLVHNAGNDVYTGEAFDKIYTTKNYKFADSDNTINVKAYLAAASADEDMTTDTVKDEIVAKAKDWAQNN